jgi:hypothetical protein
MKIFIWHFIILSTVVSRAVMTTRGNVARCKVTRGYIAAWYCRRGTVARGNVRAVVSQNQLMLEQ